MKHDGMRIDIANMLRQAKFPRSFRGWLDDNGREVDPAVVRAKLTLAVHEGKRYWPMFACPNFDGVKGECRCDEVSP